MRLLAVLSLVVFSWFAQAALLPRGPGAPRVLVKRLDGTSEAFHVLELDDQLQWRRLATGLVRGASESLAFGTQQIYLAESYGQFGLLSSIALGKIPTRLTQSTRPLEGFGVFSEDEAVGYDPKDGSIVVLSPRGESTIVPAGVVGPNLRNVTVGRTAADAVTILGSDATGAGMTVVQFDVAKGTAQKVGGQLLPRRPDTKALVAGRGIIFVTDSKSPGYVQFAHVPNGSAPNLSNLLRQHVQGEVGKAFQPLARIGSDFFFVSDERYSRLDTSSNALVTVLGHDLFGTAALEAATKGTSATAATRFTIVGAVPPGDEPYHKPLQQLYAAKTATDPVSLRFAALWTKAYEARFVLDPEPSAQLSAGVLAMLLEQFQMDADWLNVALKELGTYKDFGLDFRGYWFAPTANVTTAREELFRRLRGAPSCAKLVAKP